MRTKFDEKSFVANHSFATAPSHMLLDTADTFFCDYFLMICPIISIFKQICVIYTNVVFVKFDDDTCIG